MGAGINILILASFTTLIYTGSIITLFNPIPEIQLELEQLRVNVSGTK
jgi:hypothetical protein